MLKDFMFKGFWCLTQIQTHLLPWLRFKISLLLDLLMCIPRRCELGVRLSTVYYYLIRTLLEYRNKKSIPNSVFNAGTERSVTIFAKSTKPHSKKALSMEVITWQVENGKCAICRNWSLRIRKLAKTLKAGRRVPLSSVFKGFLCLLRRGEIATDFNLSHDLFSLLQCIYSITPSQDSYYTLL